MAASTPHEPSGQGQKVPPPPPRATPPPLRGLPTCLLGLAQGRGAPRPFPRSVEGRHADHVGGVAGQVLELHAVLSQEECLHPLGEVLPLGLPEINLQTQTMGREGDGQQRLRDSRVSGHLHSSHPHTWTGGVSDPGNSVEACKSVATLPEPSFSNATVSACLGTP